MTDKKETKSKYLKVTLDILFDYESLDALSDLGETLETIKGYASVKVANIETVQLAKKP
jgi:hypothetical protein